MTSVATTTSRDVILDAPIRCFAEKGFAATTIKDLASEAQVNSALLYYYFADKQTLYRETLRHIAERLSDSAGRRLDDELAPDDAIRRFVQQQAEFLIANPHVPRLRSEEHTSELQSPCNLVCRLLLEKKQEAEKSTGMT